MLFTLFLAYTSSTLSAQFIKEQSYSASIGFGITTPLGGEEVSGNGLFVQGEYIMHVANWLDLRPYAGFIHTSTDRDDFSLVQARRGLMAETTAFFAGGKLRLIFSVPWFSPYFESGFGISAGAFETRKRTSSNEKNGVVYHIPVGFGILLGPKREIDVSIQYFINPSVDQVFGAAAIGVSFPIY